jgi:hypothetical protein
LLNTSPRKEKRRPPSDALLVSRRDAADMIGVSTAYVVQLERAGQLRSFRLTDSPSAMKFFRRVDLLRFIEERSR